MNLAGNRTVRPLDVLLICFCGGLLMGGIQDQLFSITSRNWGCDSNGGCVWHRWGLICWQQFTTIATVGSAIRCCRYIGSRGCMLCCNNSWLPCLSHSYTSCFIWFRFWQCLRTTVVILLLFVSSLCELVIRIVNHLREMLLRAAWMSACD